MSAMETVGLELPARWYNIDQRTVQLKGSWRYELSI